MILVKAKLISLSEYYLLFRLRFIELNSTGRLKSSSNGARIDHRFASCIKFIGRPNLISRYTCLWPFDFS